MGTHYQVLKFQKENVVIATRMTLVFWPPTQTFIPSQPLAAAGLPAEREGSEPLFHHVVCPRDRGGSAQTHWLQAMASAFGVGGGAD
jgi:hypothetical protein